MHQIASLYCFYQILFLRETIEFCIKSIALSFPMQSSACCSLLCIRDLPQSVLHGVLLLKTLRVHAPETGAD